MNQPVRSVAIFHLARICSAGSTLLCFLITTISDLLIMLSHQIVAPAIVVEAALAIFVSLKFAFV